MKTNGMFPRKISAKGDGEGEYRDAEALSDGLIDAWDLEGLIHLHAATFSGVHPFRDFPLAAPIGLENASTDRRNQFAAGRYCAWQALMKAGCENPECVPVGKNRLPHWPAGWLGSISHSAGIAIAGAARATAVHALGLDVERIVTHRIFEEIHALVAQRDELELLKEMPPTQALTLVFSAKESLFKGLFPQVRTFFEFSAATLVACSDRSLTLSLSQHWGAGWRKYRRIEVAYAFHGDFVFTAFYAE